MFKLRRFCCCLFDQTEDPNKSSRPEKADTKLKELEDNSFHQKHINMTNIEIIKLTLTVIDTVHMVVGSEFEITPSGLKFSKRTVKDGCVYAGSLEKQGRAIVNDLILPENEKGIGRRHFMINYNKESGNYFIKDMGEGLGTFIKIDRPIEIKNSYIISFGDSHLIVNLQDNQITLRFIEGPKADFKKSFEPEDSPVKIGRMSDCQIRFEDTSLSRYHCLFYFDKTWKITDGDGEKGSTNGTWLFADNFFEVFDGMSFKVGETLFKAQMSNDLTNFIS